MDRFLVQRSALAGREEVLRRVAVDCSPQAVRRRGKWSLWTEEQKVRLLEKYRSCGSSYMRLRLAVPECPPRSTVWGWKLQLQQQKTLKGVGRPGLLTTPEETELLEVLTLARQRGTVLDSETVGKFASEVARFARPACSLGRDRFTRDWVTHLKKRHKLTNLRGSSSDKPPSTPVDLAADNEWRTSFEKFVQDPRAFGVDSDPVPSSLQFAVDETPLQYVPKCRGTFMMRGESDRSIYIAGSADKRQATATPLLCRDGTIPFIQIIWRGKTDRCHGVTADERLKQTHTEHKMQTRLTFLALLKDIGEQAGVCCQAMNLLPNQAWLVLVDNVSSHLGDAMKMVGPHLAAVPSISGCHLWLGRPNRSHICNPGDQQVNSAMRRLIRRNSKDRVVQFVLAIRQGSIPPETKLDMSEKRLKNLLLTWSTEWLDLGENKSLVLSSWASVLTPVDPDSAPTTSANAVVFAGAFPPPSYQPLSLFSFPRQCFFLFE